MNYLLFDDDCGICTKAAHLFARITDLPIIPMHDPSIMTKGITAIGEAEYWESFHILEGDQWSTNSNAIVNLSKYFPFGKFVHQVVRCPPILWVLSNILETLKKRRKIECKANFGASKNGS